MSERCHYVYETEWSCRLQFDHDGLHVSHDGDAVTIWRDDRCLSESDSWGRCELKRGHQELHYAEGKWWER